MLECKDCCLYDTDACRYGSYALEHNMSLNCDDFIVEHNKAYQQGRADATRWIPCSERLPEENEHVLASLKNGEIEGCAFWKESLFWQNVIAWMPLPEPYKEKIV